MSDAAPIEALLALGSQADEVREDVHFLTERGFDNDAVYWGLRWGYTWRVIFSELVRAEPEMTEPIASKLVNNARELALQQTVGVPRYESCNEPQFRTQLAARFIFTRMSRRADLLETSAI